MYKNEPAYWVCTVKPEAGVSLDRQLGTCRVADTLEYTSKCAGVTYCGARPSPFCSTVIQISTIVTGGAIQSVTVAARTY